MILAAGRGERMRPLTDDCPKPLLTVYGKPLIEHQILRLKAAGIDNIIVNTAWLAEQIEHFLDGGRPWNVTIECRNEPQGALETAGGIIQVLDFFDDEPFIVVSGDIYSDIDYRKLPTLAERCQAHLLMVENPTFHLGGDFAIDQQGLLSMQGANTFTYANVGVFRKNFFAGLDKGKRALGSVLRAKIAQGLVSGSVFNGMWHNVGTAEQLDNLQN